jgi:hypothetical protein
MIINNGIKDYNTIYFRKHIGMLIPELLLTTCKKIFYSTNII